MKLTVFGATGGIGKQLVIQALVAGHQVTAVTRAKHPFDEKVKNVVANLSNPDPHTLLESVRGADAVVSGLGPRAKTDVGIATHGTQAILEAIGAVGVERLVVVSAAPVGTVPSPGNPNPPAHDPGDGFWMRHLMAPLIKRILADNYADLARMEDALRGSSALWTAVRPPRLTDGPKTGRYRTELGRNVLGGMSISRADVAHLMLDLLEPPRAVRQVISIAY